MTPKVSILIPCHNAARWVGEAIESAIAQTVHPKEIIVIDDGSTDQSLDIIREYGDWVLIGSTPNYGSNCTRNQLLSLASGEWLQYLDADDLLLPDKVETQLQTLAQHPSADVLYSPVIIENHASRRPVRTIFPRRQYPPADPWIEHARWRLAQTGTALFRRRALLEIHGWNPRQTHCQDNELLLRLLKAGKSFAYAPRPGAVYRQWSEATLSRGNLPETHRLCLEILDQTQYALAERNELTRRRLHAISQTRFECAREIWRYDRIAAVQAFRRLRAVDPDFLPDEKSARPLFRWVLRTAGFSAAQHSAALWRVLRDVSAA